MIDAYTIGVTLALEDGVSDGLANIKRELGLLDRAIAQSAAGMDQLYRLGQKLGAVTEDVGGVPPPSAPRLIRKEAVEGRAPLDQTIPISDAVRPIPSAAQTALSSALRTRLEPRQINTADVPPVKSVIAVAPIARTQTPGQPPPEAPVAEESGFQPSPTPAAPQVTLHQFAPSVPLNPRIPEAAGIQPAVTRLVLGSESSEPPRPEPAPAFPIPLPKAEIKRPTPAALLPPLNLRITAGGATEPLAPEQPSPAVPPAREILAQTSRRPALEAGQRPPSRRAAAEVAELPDLPVTDKAAGHSANVSGDIMIDGARLGRWIGEILTSSLTRPAAGLTGVDPRAVPAWPTMQGR